MNINFVVPCLLGLESILRTNCVKWTLRTCRRKTDEFSFPEMNTPWRANINSRFAERIQILVGSFEATSFEELFRGTKALPWEQWIGQSGGFPC